jgi:hypothetical protein
MEENCWFYMDETVPEEEQTINVLCCDCHEKFPTLGWFWEGSKRGYGPFDFICEKCGHKVHEKPKEI